MSAANCETGNLAYSEDEEDNTSWKFSVLGVFEKKPFKLIFESYACSNSLEILADYFEESVMLWLQLDS